MFLIFCFVLFYIVIYVNNVYNKIFFCLCYIMGFGFRYVDIGGECLFGDMWVFDV